jgi:hypothetical protein
VSRLAQAPDPPAPPSNRRPASVRPSSKRSEQQEREEKIARLEAALRDARDEATKRETETTSLRLGVKEALDEGSLVAVRKAVGQEVPSPAKEPTHFDSWWLGPLLLTVLTPLVAITAMSAKDRTNGDLTALFDIRDVADYFQLAIVLAVLVFFVRSTEPALPRERWVNLRNCRRSVGELAGYWKAMWSGWTILYLFYSVEHLLQTHPRWVWQLPYWTAANTFITNLTIVAIYGLRLELSYPTEEDQPVTHRARTWKLLAGCVALAVIEVLVCHATAHMATPWPSLCFGVLSGTLGAMSLALLAGELRSSFLDVRAFETTLLYFYAATQPLYPILRCIGGYEDKGILLLFQFILKAISLALKLVLFRVMYRHMESGRLAFYLEKKIVARRDVGVEWEIFRCEHLKPDGATDPE